MKLKITHVHDQGKPKGEYVLLRALDDCNLGHYVLTDTTYTQSGEVSNKVRHTFHFPRKEIKKGDYVSVWTKTGTDETGFMADKSPIHRFHWGLQHAVWNDDGDCAILMYVPERQTFKVEANK